MGTLVAIKGCEHHWDRYRAQQGTWVNSEICTVLYFTGPTLGIPDDYDSLPFKTRAICRYALDMGVEFCFLPDTDTYLSPERLMASGFEDHDYSGHDFGKGYASGGAGYWLSKRAMIAVSSTAARKGYEDQWVGEVMLAAGIPLYHDHRYAIDKFVLPDNDLISCHLGHLGGYKPGFMIEAHQRFVGAKPSEAHQIQP